MLDLITEVLLAASSLCVGLFLGSGVRKFSILKVQSFIAESISTYIAGFLQNLQDHPEQAEAMIKPFIDAILKQISGPETPGAREKNFKIGGIPIPSSIVKMFLERFLGQSGKQQTGLESLLQLPQ